MFSKKYLNKIFYHLKIMVFMILVLSIEVYSQDQIVEYQLSQRIGYEIDRQERDYFYLFPGIKDFEKAQAYQLSQYSVKIDIYFTEHPGEPDTSLIISIPESQVLENYISNFELLAYGQKGIQLQKLNRTIVNLNEVWQHFSLLKKKVKKGHIEKFYIIDSDSNQYWGQFLHANDSLLFVWNDTSFFDWRKIADHLKVFHCYEIKKIIIEREGTFWGGAGTGLLIGGGIGAFAGLASGSDTEGIIQFSAGTKAMFGGLFLGSIGGIVGGIWGAAKGTDDEINVNGDKKLFEEFSCSVKENAIFIKHIPPEIYTYSIEAPRTKKQRLYIPEIIHHKETEHIVNSYPIIKKSETIEKENNIHISFMSNYTNTFADDDIADALKKSGFGGSRGNWLFGGTTEYPIDESYLLSWHVELAYSYYTNYRFGAGIKKIAPQEVCGLWGVAENLEGYTGNLFMEWIIDPYNLNLMDRWEHMLGVGITYNQLNIYRSFNYYTTGQTIEKHNYGVQLRGGIDYYPSASLSFQFKISIDIVPSFSLDEYKIFDGDEVLKKHSINLSGFDVALGFRIHI